MGNFRHLLYAQWLGEVKSKEVQDLAQSRAAISPQSKSREHCSGRPLQQSAPSIFTREAISF
jgi:hypothetical protein